jgi:zinc protease
MMVFPTVPATNEDDPVLKLLGSLLAGGPNADLTYMLKRRPEVLSVEAYQSSQELAGEFWITVTCKVDTDLNKVYREIRNELARLANAPLSAEQLQAAKNATEFSFFLPVESLHGFGGRADLLNLGALLTGDPAFVFNMAAARQKITANDLHSAVRTYLGTENSVVVCVVPTGKKEFAVSF